ncbi:uncharacterized protein TM35_000152600 [Trypanosoma theileri]|uniref:Uncharacterized protein n=1 Tax=Trypanosoma theileri TaxID=67003 RepID=A0A1X0NX89_9TRYP|nr:uncharacterized protein TM35_000152600 [Trypanosoma theileri]ORC88829.1 hypothetical protein TM35_000152600 [Trypanosoma theileri]
MMKDMKTARSAILALALLLLLQLCAAEECTEGMELPAEMSPLHLLQQSSMEWQADTQNVSNNNNNSNNNGNMDGEWHHVGAVRVVSPAGERVVRVVLQPPLATLHCEESRSRTAKFRRGSCTLHPTDNTEDDVIFHYRVAQRAAGGTHTYVGTLCRDSIDDSAAVAVGRITYTVSDGTTHTGGETGTLLHLQFGSTRVAWLPAALRLTGYTHEEAERRRMRRRVASTPLERWGYPLLFVAILYGTLSGLAWWVNRQKRQPHTSDGKPKQA